MEYTDWISAVCKLSFISEGNFDSACEVLHCQNLHY